MQGISQDTVLADRYALVQRLAGREDLEHWSARDRTLDREVAITVFLSSDPHAEAALDGARRAAGIDDSRLVRILDVGSQSDLSYIVEEGLQEATSLAQLIRERALATEEVRRIVGETASALEVARARGLHHLLLTPHAVLRTNEGRIRVSGVAVAAALEGVDDLPSEDASQQDATALVGLIYAGLTGAWPLEPAVAGVPTARRLADGTLTEPSEAALRRGSVPGDLNTLCRVTLSDDAGPRTPGELAEQIAPWPAEQVHGTGNRSAGWAAGAAGTGLAAGGTAAAADGPVGAASGGHSPADDGAADDDDDFDFYGDREDDRLESPVPLLPGNVTAEPSGDQAKVALALVAAFVVVAALLAYCGVNFAGNKSAVPSPGNSTTSQQGSASPSGTPTPSSTPKPAKKPAHDLKIAAASLMDPGNNSQENPSLVPLTVDGKSDTEWTSHGWNHADFGSVKGGVGLVYDLGSSKQVEDVKLNLPLPIGLTVYVGDRPTTDGATRLGSSDGKDGTVDVKPGGSAPKGRYVIVYITKLVQDTAYHHAKVAEVSIAGR